MIEDANQSTHCLSMCVCVCFCVIDCLWQVPQLGADISSYFPSLFPPLIVYPTYLMIRVLFVATVNQQPRAHLHPLEPCLLSCLSCGWMDRWMNKCQVPVCDDAARFWACPFRLRAFFALNWAAWFFMLCMSYIKRTLFNLLFMF